MNKRTVYAILAAVVLVCCLLPTTAFAWDDTGMTAIFTYTKEDQGSSSEGEDYVPTYEVALPAPTDLNHSCELSITLSYNAMNENQHLTVSVNPTTFNQDGYFHLTSESGDILKAELQRLGKTEAAGERIDPIDGPFDVAVFDNSGLDPIRYGSVWVDLVNDNLISPGEYTGYMHFTIELTTE